MSINPSRVYLREWLTRSAAGRDHDFRVLDAGAGDAPYRDLFSHVRYETADFAQVDKPYTDLDYVCDLAAIPVEDECFDLVICTQVLEHVPEPVAVLREFRRIVRPGGQVWISAPLFYEEHEQPFDYHRYTRFSWQWMANESGFELREIEWLEGYYTTLAYELAMAARELPRWLLPIRVAFALLAGTFARLDLRTKHDDRGMCKNYRLTLSPRAQARPTSVEDGDEDS